MNKFLKAIAWLIILTPAIYLAAVWGKMPDKMATHFDLYGNPDRYGSKNEYLIFVGIIILLNCAVYLLLTKLYKVDTKKNAAVNKVRLEKIVLVIVMLLSAITCIIIHSGIQGEIRVNIRYIFSLVGFSYAVLGNYMYNIKPNYFAGFRLPWTLENEDNWKKTHALAGKLWFIAGLGLGIACLLLPLNSVIITFLAVQIIIIIIPSVYSYRLYKAQKENP